MLREVDSHTAATPILKKGIKIQGYVWLQMLHI